MCLGNNTQPCLLENKNIGIQVRLIVGKQANQMNGAPTGFELNLNSLYIEAFMRPHRVSDISHQCPVT